MKEEKLEKVTVSQPKWKQDLTIDKYALEEECEKQANLFAEYALDFAAKLQIMEEAKLDLDIARRETKLTKEVVFATADMRVRRSAENLGEKVTEAIVKARVVTDKRFQEEVHSLDSALDEKERDYIQIKSEVEIAAGLKEACKQKKDMLGHMAFLWGADYYADPPTETRTIEKMNQKINMKGRRFKNEKTVK